MKGMRAAVFSPMRLIFALQTGEEELLRGRGPSVYEFRFTEDSNLETFLTVWWGEWQHSTPKLLEARDMPPRSRELLLETTEHRILTQASKAAKVSYSKRAWKGDPDGYPT